MSNKPLVSILVPVYNGEKYVQLFLDSALNQLFDDFEIVIVDNMSTDNSVKIIRGYVEAFPDKIQLFSAGVHHDRVGVMRNLALSYAQGKYVYICDCDDILHPNGLKELVETAEEYGCDLVCGWGYTVAVNDDESISSMSPLYKRQSQKVGAQTAIMGGVELWLRLIRRDLLDKVGPFPDVFFEDVAYLPVLQSYAENIRFVNTVVYYYLRRNSSATGLLRREVCDGSVRAEKYALEHCNPDYLDAVQYFVAARTSGNLTFRWPYLDVFIDWAREQMQWLPNNDLVTKNKALFERIQWAATLTTDLIPCRVIVNGFGEKPSESRIEELAEKVFYQGSEVIVLSEDNCDINANEYVKRAYDIGDFDFVGKYFALKEIQENGGMYFGTRIKILNLFNYYRHQNAVFFWIDDRNYSDEIFGAPAENCVITDLVSTYSDAWDKKGSYISLSERIKIILTAKYEIPLNGAGRGFRYPVSTVPPNCGVIDIAWGEAVCEHDYSDHAGDEEYITLKRSTVELLSRMRIPTGKSSREKALERELANMKRTNTYKLMMKIRAIGDGPFGPFLKKIFHGLLKIREKFKRK